MSTVLESGAKHVHSGAPPAPWEGGHRTRLTMLVAVGVSYALDAVFLACFWWLGRVELSLPLLYVAAGLGQLLLFTLAFRIGDARGQRDLLLTEWQMAAAIAVQLGAVLLAPWIKAYFLCIIFVVFAFGTLSLSVRRALLMWLGTCAMTALTLQWLPSQHTVPVSIPANALEAVLVGVAYASILLRCLLLNHYGTLLRTRLIQRQRKLAEEVEAVHRLASHDLLTGALNRHAMLPLLEGQIQLVQRGRQVCALALIDLDHFKRVNDNHGHLTGDQVLCRVVDTMEATLRPSDKLARYGGEEFLLLMPATTLAEAEVVLERVRAAVALQHWQDLVPGWPITLSAGITNVHPSDRLDDVLARADTSLYQAKNSGRNRCVSLPMV